MRRFFTANMAFAEQPKTHPLQMNTPEVNKGLNPFSAWTMKGLLASACLLLTAPAFAATVRTFVGAPGDNLLGNANDWSPAGVPSASANDTLQWNGSAAGNLLLTNSTANFDANPGFYINVTAAQVGSISI